MVSDTDFRDRSARIDLYLDLWERAGAAAFEVADLPPDIGRTGRTDPDTTIAAREGDEERLRQRLEDLVAVGLLDRREDGRYRIRLTPTGSLDEWHAKSASRIDELHGAVQDRLQRREGASPGREDPVVRFEEATYLSHTVDADVRFADLVAALDELLDGNPETSRVVLRCPGDDADRIQRHADRLCDPAEMASQGVAPFEKVTTQVLGRNHDDLEYRLYLRRREE